AGGKAALPIFEQLLKTVWTIYPQTPLPRPSPEAARHLVALPIDIHSGQRLSDGNWQRNRFDVRGADGGRYANVSGGFMEYFRLDERGQLEDTQDRLSSRGSILSEGGGPFQSFQSLFGGPNGFGGPGGFSGGYPGGP